MKILCFHSSVKFPNGYNYTCLKSGEFLFNVLWDALPNTDMDKYVLIDI